MTKTNECKNCKSNHQRLGKTEECFKCNPKEWYAKYHTSGGKKDGKK